MSAEVVKKRGRPKKVVSESIPAESMETVKTGTQQKSNKASSSLTSMSNKAAKLSTFIPENTSDTSIAVQKKTSKKQASTVAANTKPPSPPLTTPEATSGTLPVLPNSSTTSSPPKVTSANSKILNQVRALSSKAPSAAKSSRTTSKPLNPTSPASPASPATSKHTNSPSQTTITKPSKPPPLSKPSLPKIEQEPPVSSQPGVSNTASKPSPGLSNSQHQTQHPQKSIPIAALNSSIVSQISSRAGARPSRPPTDLPANYKPVARRVTLAIVALPIAIVTSWVLYQRLVLGEERKQLVRPGMVMVEESPSIREAGANVSEKDT